MVDILDGRVYREENVCFWSFDVLVFFFFGVEMRDRRKKGKNK